MAVNASRILAIRFARFGDVVLLLPALSLLKSLFPGSRITFLTDQRLTPLAAMCPAIDNIIAVDRIAMRDGSRWNSIYRMRQVVGEVRQRRFDIAIDFHGFRETNLLTGLSGARQRIGLHRFGQSFLNFCFNLPAVPEDKNIHAGEMFKRVVERFGAGNPPASPALVVPETSRLWAKATLPASPFVALYVDAPTPLRIWPPERFAAVADYFSGCFGMDVVAIAGSEGASLLSRVCEKSKFPKKIRAFSNLTIPQLAAAVELARLWISNDTGPLHLGPILGVQTLGLFSIGLPQHFKPTGLHDSYVLGNPIEEITVETVIGRLEEMLPTDYPDLRR